MIGGVITSAILELLIYPVIYVIWRKRELPSGTGGESLSLNDAIQEKPKRNTFRWLLQFLMGGLIAVVLFAGGFAGWNWWKSGQATTAQVQGEPIATRTVGELTISVYGDLHSGASEVVVRFTDSSGQPKDVGEVKTGLTMNMPGMVMNSGGQVTKTSTAGVYRAKLQPQMGGDWVLKLSWQGLGGQSQVEIPMSVKQ
jgi:hypothetical protein